MSEAIASRDTTCRPLITGASAPCGVRSRIRSSRSAVRTAKSDWSTLASFYTAPDTHGMQTVITA